MSSMLYTVKRLGKLLFIYCVCAQCTYPIPHYQMWTTFAYLVEAPPPNTWTQSPAGRDANQGGIAEDHEETDGDSQF